MIFFFDDIPCLIVLILVEFAVFNNKEDRKERNKLKYKVETNIKQESQDERKKSRGNKIE